jgi:hypothetical protein
MDEAFQMIAEFKYQSQTTMDRIPDGNDTIQQPFQVSPQASISQAFTIRIQDLLLLHLLQFLIKALQTHQQLLLYNHQ